jgi:hypothetical protein
MPISHLIYTEFVDMFQSSRDFSSYQEDDMITIKWKSVKCRNEAREAGGWSAFCWKPYDSSNVDDDKWRRMEYNGSSSFAAWWCAQEDDEDSLMNDKDFLEDWGKSFTN